LPHATSHPCDGSILQRPKAPHGGDDARRLTTTRQRRPGRSALRLDNQTATTPGKPGFVWVAPRRPPSTGAPGTQVIRSNARRSDESDARAPHNGTRPGGKLRPEVSRLLVVSKRTMVRLRFAPLLRRAGEPQGPQGSKRDRMSSVVRTDAAPAVEAHHLLRRRPMLPCPLAGTVDHRSHARHCDIAVFASGALPGRKV